MNKLFCMLVLMLGMFFVSCKDDDNNSPTSPIDNTQNQDTTGNGNTGEEYANPDYKTLPNLPMDGTYTWGYQDPSAKIFRIYLTNMFCKKYEYKNEEVLGYLCNEIHQSASNNSKVELYYFEYDNAIFKVIDLDDNDSKIIRKAEFICPAYWVEGASFNSDGVSVSVSNTEITWSRKKYHAQEYSFNISGKNYKATFVPGFGMFKMEGSKTLSLIQYLGT